MLALVGPLTLLLRWDLVIKKLLDMVDGKEMLAIHGYDNSIPNLGNENLGFVLNLHVCCGEDLGIDSLWQPREDVSPGRPDRGTDVERSSNRSNGIEKYVEKIGVEEEEDEISNEQKHNQDSRLVPAKNRAEKIVTHAAVHVDDRQVSNSIS